MRHSNGFVVALSVGLVALTFAGPARADHETYLSLGDSLAFGVGADQTLGDVSNGDRGYVSAFADFLGATHGERPKVINLGISGETTSSVFSGTGRNDATSDPLRNTNYQGLSPLPTQHDLFAAVVGAENSLGQTISTVSVSLGSNDLLQLALNPAFQAADPATQGAMLMQTLGQVATNYSALLQDIRTLLPSAEVILVGSYSPFGPASPSTPPIALLNDVIKNLAIATGSTFVDIFTPFLGNEAAYTYIANAGNFHPTPAGYRVIADAMITAVPEPGSVTLLVLGGLGVLGLARSRRRRAA